MGRFAARLCLAVSRWARCWCWHATQRLAPMAAMQRPAARPARPAARPARPEHRGLLARPERWGPAAWAACPCPTGCPVHVNFRNDRQTRSPAASGAPRTAARRSQLRRDTLHAFDSRLRMAVDTRGRTVSLTTIRVGPLTQTKGENMTIRSTTMFGLLGFTILVSPGACVETEDANKEGGNKPTAGTGGSGTGGSAGSTGGRGGGGGSTGGSGGSTEAAAEAPEVAAEAPEAAAEAPEAAAEARAVEGAATPAGVTARGAAAEAPGQRRAPEAAAEAPGAAAEAPEAAGVATPGVTAPAAQVAVAAPVAVALAVAAAAGDRPPTRAGAGADHREVSRGRAAPPSGGPAQRPDVRWQAPSGRRDRRGRAPTGRGRGRRAGATCYFRLAQHVAPPVTG